ncbi:MAG: glycogen/starch/alpha-glucan phosphorylase, partial [Acholeplasmataceae bacterium]
ELSNLLNETIGNAWIDKPNTLENVLKFQQDKTFRTRYKDVKAHNKQRLAQKIEAQIGVKLDPNSIFDIHVKRLHEYKRQLLNALHIMYLYNELKENPSFRERFHPQSFIFGAKSAPTYYFAKKIIKLINTIQEKVNNDEEISKYLKVAFVEDYNVTYAEMIMPAADISEQISTASKEASGTGNMKFMMNGAMTLGTLDGANVEIHELVGKDNIILFGMKAEEVTKLEKDGTYKPYEIYLNNPKIRKVIDQLTNGFFEDVSVHEFEEIKTSLLEKDQYFILKDFDSYRQAQERANKLYQNQEAWLDKTIYNTAKSGFFSTDRTIDQYNKDIWKLKPIK